MPNKSDRSFDKHVGSRIRALRIVRGITQTELAEHGGITFQQIQKYEKGTNRVSPSRLAAFAKVLRVEPDYFFREELAIEIKDDPAATELLAFAGSREGIYLARAFQKMTPKQRRAMVELVEAMAALKV